jgi:hypothetical protein
MADNETAAISSNGTTRQTTKKETHRRKEQPEATKFHTECQKEHENSLQCEYLAGVEILKRLAMCLHFAVSNGFWLLRIHIFVPGIYSNYENQLKCQPFFDIYRACKKEEHKRILEERAKNPKPLF